MSALSPCTSPPPSYPLDAMVFPPAATAANSQGAIESTMPTSMQIVNEHKEFNLELAYYMKDLWKLYERGFNYHVVGVFGSQSTGKSTLLNLMFGTSFAVMREEERRQTTRGIWTSVGTLRDNILVMDVEGADSREHGDNQDFERKSALFALAVAEVLIINMWEHSVGLYHGANYALLKTVFEVNLQLFQQKDSPKTMIMFILRDYLGKTPLSNLEATLKSDIYAIWKEISKPESFQESVFEDLFDVSFVALPHKFLQEEAFVRTVQHQLIPRFLHPNHPEYVFKPEYHRRIPADGFSCFCEDIWSKVLDNKDLDLPTERQMLAQFRCDQIVRDVLTAVAEPEKALLQQQMQSADLLESFLKTPLMSLLDQRYYTKTLHEFDAHASRYDPHVYELKRQELLEKLTAMIRPVVEQYYHIITDKTVEMFVDALENSYHDNKDFHVAADTAHKNALQYFNRYHRPSTFYLNTEHPHEGLISALEEKRAQISNEYLRVWREAVEKRGFQFLRDECQSLFHRLQEKRCQGPLDFWEKASEKYGQVMKTLEESQKKLVTQWEKNPTEAAKFKAAMSEAITEQLLHYLMTTLCTEHSIIYCARSQFDLIFKYTEMGLPRMWRPGDALDDTFQSAKQTGESILETFREIQLEGMTHGETKALLSPDAHRVLVEKYRKETERSYLEAQRSMNAIQTRVPLWMIVLLIVLGWNEFKSLLRHPFYVLLLALLAGSYYVVHTMHLGAPVIQMGQLLLRQAIQWLQLQLQQIQPSPQHHIQQPS